MTETVWHHETRIKVRYAETDQMGVVHHATYYVYFEAARSELLEAWGLPYHRMEAEGYAVPVVESRCRHLAPARFGDEVAVRVALSFPDRVRLRFDVEAVRVADGTRLAVGHTVHVGVGREGRPARLLPALVERARAAGLPG